MLGFEGWNSVKLESVIFVLFTRKRIIQMACGFMIFSFMSISLYKIALGFGKGEDGKVSLFGSMTIANPNTFCNCSLMDIRMIELHLSFEEDYKAELHFSDAVAFYHFFFLLVLCMFV